MDLACYQFISRAGRKLVDIINLFSKLVNVTLLGMGQEKTFL